MNMRQAEGGVEFRPVSLSRGQKVTSSSFLLPGSPGSWAGCMCIILERMHI